MISQRLPEATEKRATQLLHDFVDELEQVLGNRRMELDSVRIRQADAGPGCEVQGNNATLYVGPNATKYEPTLVANLAHESVHLLEATTGRASRLEEGFAVDYELLVIGRLYGPQEVQHFEKYLPSSYIRAREDYRKLLALDPSTAIRIRQTFGKLTGPTCTDLRSVVPTLSRWLAYRLARRIQMRP